MNDDRTEQALRRALDDAARQVDVPMARLPEPSLVSADRPPRRPTAVVACLVAIVVLAAGSLVVLAARDDGTSSVQIGAAPPTDPLTAENADATISFDLAAPDTSVAAVAAFLDGADEVAAYTFVSPADALAEVRLLHACSGIGASLTPDDMQPRLRVRLTDVAQYETLAGEVVAMPGVESVDGRTGTERFLAPSTTEPVSSTTVVPPAEPTTAPSSTTSVPGVERTVTTSSDGKTSTVVLEVEATTTTAPPEDPTTTVAPTTVPSSTTSKEIPFVLPAPAQCPPSQSTRTPSPTVVIGAPAATDVTLPSPGEQPAGRASSEQAVRDMLAEFYASTTTVARRYELSEAYPELVELLDEARLRNPSYVQSGARVFSVVFVSPTRAAFDYQIQFTSGASDVRQIGYAVLVDGTWKVARETTCRNIARGGVHCPEGP